MSFWLGSIFFFSFATAPSVVITSYSIHYTKLYESLGAMLKNSSPSVLVRFATDLICLSPQRMSYGIEGISLMCIPAQTRITSYNVCYTKLLRVPVKTEIHQYKLEDANTALDDLRNGRINGAAVLVMDKWDTGYFYCRMSWYFPTRDWQTPTVCLPWAATSAPRDSCSPMKTVYSRGIQKRNNFV